MPASPRSTRLQRKTPWRTFDDGILITSPKNSGIVAPHLGMDDRNQIVVGGWHNYSPS